MFDFLNEKDRQPARAATRAPCGGATPSTGQVQGVGFRYRARYAAQSLDLTGWVQNEDDGSGHAGGAGRPDNFISSCSPSSSAATISRLLPSASATSPPTHGSGISGCAATDNSL
ncbi:MAG: acylphosphatase [Faecalibacterium prausnitzii]